MRVSVRKILSIASAIAIMGTSIPLNVMAIGDNVETTKFRELSEKQSDNPYVKAIKDAKNKGQDEVFLDVNNFDIEKLKEAEKELGDFKKYVKYIFIKYADKNNYENLEKMVIDNGYQGTVFIVMNPNVHEVSPEYPDIVGWFITDLSKDIRAEKVLNNLIKYTAPENSYKFNDSGGGESKEIESSLDFIRILRKKDIDYIQENVDKIPIDKDLRTSIKNSISDEFFETIKKKDQKYYGYGSAGLINLSDLIKDKEIAKKLIDTGVRVDFSLSTTKKYGNNPDTLPYNWFSGNSEAVGYESTTRISFFNRIKGKVNYKELDGNNKKLNGGEFEFVLKDKNGIEVDRTKNDKDGNFTFKTIDYYKNLKPSLEERNVFLEQNKFKDVYTVEQICNNQNLKYDESKKNIDIAIETSRDNGVTCSYEYKPTSIENLVFNNENKILDSKPIPKPVEPVNSNWDRYLINDKKVPTYPVKAVVLSNSLVKKDKLHYIFTIDKDRYKEVRNGVTKEHDMDVTPIIKSERTMLPLRYVAEALDAKVDWNKETRTATFIKGGIKAEIQIDGDEIKLNDKIVKMDSKPLNINSRILVPVVNVANVFNMTNGNTKDGIDQDIEWDNDSRTVTIYVKR